MSQTITADLAVNGTPGSPTPGLIRPTPAQNVRLEADPRQQYVSAGPPQWLINAPRVLDYSIDSITRDFGADVYERMLLYPACAAALQVLKTGIMDAGVNLTSAQPDREKEGYAQATAFVDWCSAILDDLETSIHQVLWNMLDAVAFGCTVTEKVYDDETTYTGRRQLILRRLAVKPRTSTAFVVDAYKNVLGLLGLIPGQGQGVQVGLVITDLANQPNLIPREKFAIYTFRPQNADPRGTSVLRPAFDSWNQAIQLIPEFMKYLTQFASPSLVGLTAPDAQLLPITDATGAPILDVNGNPQTISPERLMADALQEFRNGSVLSFPSGSVVQPIAMMGDGQQFLQAFERFDQQIIKAILSTTLATEEGRHMARAAASVHQDALDTIIRQEKRTVADMIRRDILRPLVILNYGPEAARWTPTVSLGAIEQEDQSSRIMAFAQAWSTGFFGYSQLPALYRMLGLPERDPADGPAIVQERAQVREEVQESAPPTDTTGTGATQPVPATPPSSAGATTKE